MGQLMMIDFAAGKLVPVVEPLKSVQPALKGPGGAPAEPAQPALKGPGGAPPKPEAPRYIPAYCDPANERRGAAFDRNLSVKEIAKLMRQAIKKELPGVKVSVRMDGWNCIRMALVDCAKAGIDPNPIIPMAEWNEIQDRAGYLNRQSWKENFQPEMVELMRKLYEILNRWNRDNSDPMSDYSDVHYYHSLSDDDMRCWCF